MYLLECVLCSVWCSLWCSKYVYMSECLREGRCGVCLQYMCLRSVCEHMQLFAKALGPMGN